MRFNSTPSARAASPAIRDDRIFLQCDAPDDPYLVAVSLADGRELWRTSRKAVCERSWATPFVYSDGTRTHVVANGWPYAVSYDAMTGPHLLGFGHRDPACEPSCFTQVDGYNFGLGVVRSGSWILQNPQLSGFSATEAYLPSQGIAIAVAVTYLPAAFDAQGNYPNAADSLFRSIGAVVAPDDPPPVPNG